MKTDGNEEQLYEPGDHLAVFAENSSELVSAVIGLIDNAPGADEPLKMEICKETSGTIAWRYSYFIPDTRVAAQNS